MLSIATPVGTAASNTNCQIDYEVTQNDSARTAFTDATVDTSSGSGEIDFFIDSKMQETLYIRAKVILTDPSEIAYVEEVAFDINVINPCELIGGTIL